ncbi:MAG: hypothetical protein M1828_000699 [Chrysothrix sp. TS-e1954]|nr:MAG: hypothetical protein M1828_000699 [Chrysothrix sp. TS-e1954]
MLSRKPALICTFGLQSIASPTSQLNASVGRERPPRKHIYRPHPVPFRTYASAQHLDPGQFSDEFDWWPEVQSHQKHPTPYQIFNQEKSEPYSKRRFYELVKLYHPDRNSHLQGSQRPSKCSHDVRLERYRLIIAANDILSDPSKRIAYDRFGWGWGEAAELKPKYDTHRRDPDGKGWMRWSTEQNPMYCATWEDWEQWYEQTGQKRSSARQRQTLYANNYAVISLVALVALLSGIGQATRMNNFTAVQSDRVQLVNEQSSHMLMRARDGAKDPSGVSETRQDRMRRFVRERERYSEDEFDGRALDKDDPGMCVSGATKDRDEEPFWKKPPDIR